MEIDPATQGDAGIYECHANNKYKKSYSLYFTLLSSLTDMCQMCVSHLIGIGCIRIGISMVVSESLW